MPSPLPVKWTPDPSAVEAAFARQRSVDPFGHRLHALLGACWCATLCGPVSVIEFGLIPLLVCFLIRFPRHFPTHRYLRHTWAPWLVVAWGCWQAATIAWSLDQHQGLEEWGVIRFAPVVLLLWPVLDRRSWLIGGLVIGMLMANGAQVAHAIGSVYDLPGLTFDRLPNRNSGWWQPVVGGTMLTAAVGLHLPAALTSRGKWRLVGIAGLAASIAGVAATGSRGAWLATAALLVLGAGWFARRLMRGGLRWGHLPLIVAMLVVLGAAGYRTLWPGMRDRATEGVHEVMRILNSGDYSTYTGARIVMARWALDAFVAHPMQGIGAGSFRPWVAQEFVKRGKDPAENPAHAHSHNTLLHVAATTGVLGLLIFSGIVILSVRGGFAGNPAGYAAGPVFALLGMLLVSPFDVVNINAQTAALWWVVITLCIWGRPGGAGEAGGHLREVSSTPGGGERRRE